MIINVDNFRKILIICSLIIYIMEQYKNHPSIIDIKNEANLNANTDDFPHATAEVINTVIKDLNPKIPTGLDKI